jgi:hypothetical protein
MHGDEIHMRFPGEHARFMGLQPVPRLDERTKHIDPNVLLAAHGGRNIDTSMNGGRRLVMVWLCGMIWLTIQKHFT